MSLQNIGSLLRNPRYRILFFGGFAVILFLLSMAVIGVGIGEPERLDFFVTDSDGGDEPFVFEVDTRHSDYGTTDSERFRINTNSDMYSYKYDVSTDGNVTNETSELRNVNGDLVLDFENPGVYTVEITGKFPHMHYGLNTDSAKIIGVDEWGTIQWKNMSRMFIDAENLDGYGATDEPDLSDVENMSWMFGYSNGFSGDIGEWNTGNVRNMSSMFARVDECDCNISGLDTSNVRDMSSMFALTSINPDVSSWDTGSVRNISKMFYHARSFNQSIEEWNTGKVRDMSEMFDHAESFNGDVSDWDTGNVRNMSRMFFAAESFNRDIGSWDTSSVRDMSDMFGHAESFNHSIGSWDTSNVRDIEGMFYNADSFNRDISSWDTGEVQDMFGVFNDADSFNKDISSWCASQISHKPDSFSHASPIDGTDKVPKWGSPC